MLLNKKIYKDKVYAGNLVAKLGIYCGTIEKLEEKGMKCISLQDLSIMKGYITGEAHHK